MLKDIWRLTSKSSCLNIFIPPQTADEYQFSGVVYTHDVSSVATKHNLIAVGYLGNSVKLLDLRCGSSIHTLRGHRSSVLAVRWSTRNEYLLATGRWANN